MCGSNDMLDSRSVTLSFNRIMKTGFLPAASISSNVNDNSNSDIFCAPGPLPSISSNADSLCPNNWEIPHIVLAILDSLDHLPTSAMATMKRASLAFVSGFVVHCIEKKHPCLKCLDNISQPRSSRGILSLISNQDNGNLTYPSMRFISVIEVINDFVERAVQFLPSRKIGGILEAICVPKVGKCEMFQCGTDSSHAGKMAKLVVTSFVPVLLTNIGKTSTELLDVPKYLNCKPLNRKMLRL